MYNFLAVYSHIEINVCVYLAGCRVMYPIVVFLWNFCEQ